MSAIEASSGTYRSRVDGTIVLSVEIEPRNAAAALALFGMPGTPMAIAALQVGYASAGEPIIKSYPEKDNSEKPKGGPLAKSAGIICGDSLFQEFSRQKGYTKDATGAKNLITAFCGVVSRSYLDHDECAASRYAELMLKFRVWQKESI